MSKIILGVKIDHELKFKKLNALSQIEYFMTFHQFHQKE